MLKIIGFFCAVCLISVLHAQDGLLRISGKVLNSVTTQPLRAKVTFYQEPAGNNVFITDSDPQAGNYKLEVFTDELYRAEIQAEGYKSLVCVLSKRQLDSAGYNWNFYLEPGKDTQLFRLENLIFAQSRADIPTSAFAELNELAEILRKNPGTIVQLEGHTDFRGDPEVNERLSKKRVEMVKKYLVEKGISKSRIRLKAFGGSMPLSRENTEAAAKANRRVEVRVIQGNIK